MEFLDHFVRSFDEPRVAADEILEVEGRALCRSGSKSELARLDAPRPHTRELRRLGRDLKIGYKKSRRRRGGHQEADVEMHQERGRDEIDTANRRRDRAAPANGMAKACKLCRIQILMQRRDERGGPSMAFS